MRWGDPVSLGIASGEHTCGGRSGMACSGKGSSKGYYAV